MAKQSNIPENRSDNDGPQLTSRLKLPMLASKQQRTLKTPTLTAEKLGDRKPSPILDELVSYGVSH